MRMLGTTDKFICAVKRRSIYFMNQSWAHRKSERGNIADNAKEIQYCLIRLLGEWVFCRWKYSTYKTYKTLALVAEKKVCPKSLKIVRYDGLFDSANR